MVCHGNKHEKIVLIVLINPQQTTTQFSYMRKNLLFGSNNAVTFADLLNNRAR
jgi:hypothetical protein